MLKNLQNSVKFVFYVMYQFFFSSPFKKILHLGLSLGYSRPQHIKL